MCPILIFILFAVDPISSGLVMAVLWLLIAVIGITAKEVFCKIDPGLGEPPPLPEEGKYTVLVNQQSVLSGLQKLCTKKKTIIGHTAELTWISFHKLTPSLISFN